jgi:hypothetical protein
MASYISKVTECEMVHYMADFLRDAGCQVLLARATNTAITFPITNSTRKGPDIIAFREGKLLVLEAKRSLRGLYTAKKNAMSDVDTLLFLESSKSAQKLLIGEIELRHSAVKVDEVQVGMVFMAPRIVDSEFTFSNLLAYRMESRSSFVRVGAVAPKLKGLI